ncbi:MAG: di-trans,poly-cis-decaprenylcistransferase [Candidatus Micrarchaeota archaeon]|nr:di-trans,poly-cis-decaprenylcistransferase [Candidatus Micrarchaeota archaeon]
MARRTKQLPFVPKHLALIPDGNRRWSSSHRLEIFNGYHKGVKKFIDFSIWAKGFGVKTLTVWALSTENIKNRSKTEIDILYKLYVNAAKDPHIFETLKKNGASIKIIGNSDLLPKRVKDALLSLERRTMMYKDFTINLLIGYGGRDDLLYAFNRVVDSAHKDGISNITESMVNESMRTSSIPDVDFIIRTSGEMRLSGFLPWQSDYSELYFAKKYWPDFDKKDLEKALKVFSERHRRFGK